MFNLIENSTDKSYLEIINKPNGVQIWDITDAYNTVEINYNNVGSDLNAIVPNSTIARKLIATSDILTPTSISKYNFSQIDPASHDYIIISHKDMMKPAGQYSNVVNAYANYRGTEAGGKYNSQNSLILKNYTVLCHLLFFLTFC